MLPNVSRWINSISLCDRSIVASSRLSKLVRFIRRILFRDRSIFVSDGPLWKTPCGISLILLPDKLILDSVVENDKRPASMSTILLSDKSRTRICLRSWNKLLEMAQMLFPERRNSHTDVMPRNVSVVTVRLLPERLTFTNVVWLSNIPSGSRRRKLCDRSSDWSLISGVRAEVGRSLSWLNERFKSVSDGMSANTVHGRVWSKLPAKISSLSTDASTSVNASWFTKARPKPERSILLTRSPAKARDWILKILVSPWNDNSEYSLEQLLNAGTGIRCPRSAHTMLLS